MLKNLPNGYPLYDTVYGSEIPLEQYYVIIFDTLPSKMNNNLSYDPKLINVLKENGFVEEKNIFSSNRRFDLASQSLFSNMEKQIMIRTLSNLNKDKDNLIQIDVAYNLKNGTLDEQISFLNLKNLERAKKKCNIQLVKSEHGHLDTEEYDLYVPPMNLELNYGKQFTKINDKIVSKLNENNGKGIILLHGDPGTGKTSYIKYLTSLIKEKDILFIPPSMAEMLSEPSIIPFLMDHKNSILIIEDAERVISDRESSGSPAGVSNILNLTDGILGDCLSIQILATFNMDRKRIDQALLRKGRLIVEHKFEKLSVQETNNLLKHLGKDTYSDIGLSLADIYNIDSEVFKSTTKTKIGF